LSVGSSELVSFAWGFFRVYHPKHFPLQALAVYPTVLRVIAFAPIPFPLPDPAFCSTRIIRSASALSTTAT